MRSRVNAFVAVLVAAAVAGGGTFLQRSVGAKPAGAATADGVVSGAWYCPHGGGSGWRASVTVANPGDRSVSFRVTPMGPAGRGQPLSLAVGPRSSTRVSVPAADRASASVVEYFGGWVAASWTAVAGGSDHGAAAAPCAPDTATRWFLPDGTTARGEDAWVVVMNPSAEEAVFSLRLVSETRTVENKDWSDFVLPGRHSIAFHLNQKDLGDRTVATDLSVSIGRVAAASLGVTSGGGVRSAIGVPATASDLVLPGGDDTGLTEIVLFDPAGRPATYGVSAQGADGPIPLPSLQTQQLPAVGVKTVDLQVTSPSTVVVAAGSGSVAAVRRTFGKQGDEASVQGVAPARAWVLGPSAVDPADAQLVYLSNPGRTDVTVTLTILTASGAGGQTAITVPAGTTVDVPAPFTAGNGIDAILAVARGGTFVPLSTSSSASGGSFATEIGLPIPARWLPA